MRIKLSWILIAAGVYFVFIRGRNNIPVPNVIAVEDVTHSNNSYGA